MSKRLQVLFDEAELRALRKVARVHRMTLSEWVRQALRTARHREPVQDSTRKLASVRASAQHSFPVTGVDEMLTQIERGYLGDEPT